MWDIQSINIHFGESYQNLPKENGTERTKAMDWTNLTVEIRGREFDIVVYGQLNSGGSNRYGSDEPAWRDVEILDIRGHNKNKSVSPRLWDAIMEQYEDIIVDKFFGEYY
jgi:hypothetical protein